MRLGILANILGNHHALEAALTASHGQHVDSWLVLGNGIGFGPHDNQVLKHLRSIRLTAYLKGQNEVALFYNNQLNNLDMHLAQTIIKSREKIETEHKVFLEQCPLQYTHLKTYLFLPHLASDRGQVYQLSEFIQKTIEKYQGQIIITSWVPQSCTMLCDGDKIKISNKSLVNLNDSSVKLINVGSVGISSNGSTACQLAILDDKSETVEFFEVDYDFTKTQRDMKISGISQQLIKKLSPNYNRSFYEE